MMYCGNCHTSTDLPNEECDGWLIVRPADYDAYGGNKFEVCPACVKLLIFVKPAFEGL